MQALQGSPACSSRLSHGSSRSQRPSRGLHRTYAQAERRVQRITVAGPPDGQPARVIEVDDPQAVPVEVIRLKDLQQEIQARQASVSKSEAREQAALIQAQKHEISSLRQALAETQDVMLKGKQTYNDVVHTKDLQIAQLYELAANGVRERARLRQEVTEVQQELQGTKRQLYAFMASLMQLKSSMASAGEGDIDHALELLQSSSFSASLQGAANFTGNGSVLAADDEVYAQLQQMQQLSETLVQDMRQDEALLSQGLTGSSSLDSTYDFDSIDSVDMYGSSGPGANSRAGAASSSGGGSGAWDAGTGASGGSSSSGSAAGRAWRTAMDGGQQPPPSNGHGSGAANGSNWGGNGSGGGGGSGGRWSHLL